MTSTSCDADYLVIGGGFFGCCLALFLRSISERVSLVEERPDLLDRASRVNQARIHSGFHYPRSPLTAVKSHLLRRRFTKDFPSAVVDDFQMLYAIGKNGSKVDAARFFRMYRDMGCEIERATPSQAALFDLDSIEGVFACTEFAFDYRMLRQQLAVQLASASVDVHTDTEIVAIRVSDDHVEATSSSGVGFRARYAFNVTYSRVNDLLRMAGQPQAPLKHELTETALIDPPSDIVGYGITVMDGRYFSTMPYPPSELYSLTHVRYTPHLAWTDREPDSVDARFGQPKSISSHVRLMVADSARYLPAMQEAVWRDSMFEVKTVLLKSERDDGRPILFHRTPGGARFISILGGKLDNLYDLFAVMRREEPEWSAADDRWISPGT